MSTRDQTVAGRAVARRPPTLEEKLQHVAAGRAISFVPASLAATVSHAGIAYVPVTDIPPIKICLAWMAGNPSRLIENFAACVKDARRRKHFG